MSRFTSADFASLDDFALLWRWTSEDHHVLPADALRSIQPLTPARAAQLAPVAAARCAERRVVDLELAISAEWDAPEPVRQRLRETGVPHDTPVLVSWNSATAVLTRWDTFTQYWDAFCYPASDDITVWSLDGDWTLCYRHFQAIEFGRNRAAT